MGACIAILGLTFGTVSIAQNYYKSSGSSEKEEYQMAEKEKEKHYNEVSTFWSNCCFNNVTI